jgi:hypothetical protein
MYTRRIHPGSRCNPFSTAGKPLWQGLPGAFQIFHSPYYYFYIYIPRMYLRVEENKPNARQEVNDGISNFEAGIL